MSYIPQIENTLILSTPQNFIFGENKLEVQHFVIEI
jgi:hypothetical protein